MSPCSFLQSREWEEFQQSMGRRTWRVDGILVIGHDIPAGMNYLYCPRPPLGDKGQGTRDKFFGGAASIARRERSIFLKIDPVEPFQVSSFKFQISRPLQPQHTVILDLQKSESELLAAMHEKTRYNIRLAERRGVRITTGENRNARGDFDTFWRLLQETADRDMFHTHARTYYEKLSALHTDDFSNELFFAEYGGEIAAAALINFYRPSRRATYLHGASGRAHRDVMAPHLLQWRIMEEAKKRGFADYDLWGIDEKKWPGVTRFKRGFGGCEVSFPQSVDVVYRSALYAAYRFIKRSR